VHLCLFPPFARFAHKRLAQKLVNKRPIGYVPELPPLYAYVILPSDLSQ
jgi:hypothetical protein